MEPITDIMSDLETRIEQFLYANFPQIEMHGGSFDILELDEDRGYVKVLLSDACSGCGISPMTIQAIKNRMKKEVPEINTVVAKTGEMEDVEIEPGPF